MSVQFESASVGGGGGTPHHPAGAPPPWRTVVQGTRFWECQFWGSFSSYRLDPPRRGVRCVRQTATPSGHVPMQAGAGKHKVICLPEGQRSKWRGPNRAASRSFARDAAGRGTSVAASPACSATRNGATETALARASLGAAGNGVAVWGVSHGQGIKVRWFYTEPQGAREGTPLRAGHPPWNQFFPFPGTLHQNADAFIICSCQCVEKIT